MGVRGAQQSKMAVFGPGSGERLELSGATCSLDLTRIFKAAGFSCAAAEKMTDHIGTTLV